MLPMHLVAYGTQTITELHSLQLPIMRLPQNMGDIAVDWNKGTIWIGTGENNSSRSSYSGIGILKSTDKGKTWQNVGLKDSHHVGRIIINKNNPDEVVVGVIGHFIYPKCRTWHL